MTQRSICTAGRTRRRWSTTAAAMLTAALTASTLAGCGSGGGDAGPKLGLDEPLPQSVPQGTVLRIGDPTTEVALSSPARSTRCRSSSSSPTSAAARRPPRRSGPRRSTSARSRTSRRSTPPGPGCTSRSSPPSSARTRSNHPIYQLGIAPGVDGEDARGPARARRSPTAPGRRRARWSCGCCKKAGLTKEDVEAGRAAQHRRRLLERAAGKQVDVAPIGGVQIKRYLTKYGKDGATTIQHGLRDDAGHLYVPTECSRTRRKAAAIRAYVQPGARAGSGSTSTPKEWIAGLLREGPGPDRARTVSSWSTTPAHPDIRADWTTRSRGTRRPSTCSPRRPATR